VTLSTSFNGSLSRVDYGVVTGVASTSLASCNAGGGFNYTWAVTDGLGTSVAVPTDSAAWRSQASTPTLTFPPLYLATGPRARVTLRVCYAGAPPLSDGSIDISLCGSSAVTFTVVSAPLLAVLSGGDAIVGELPLLLDASLSIDTSAEPVNLVFAWACVGPTGGSCFSSTGALLAFAPGAPNQTVTLQGSSLASGGKLYSITVTVSKGSRVASTTSTLSVFSSVLPIVAVQGLSTAAVLASQRVVLYATVSSRNPASLATTWSVTPAAGSPALNLSSPLVAATPTTSRSFVLLPNVLKPGASYTFRLTATDSDGTAYAQLPLAVASSPRGLGGAASGALSVLPASGIALQDNFMLTASAWAGDAPLAFSFLYSVDGTNFIALTDFQPLASINVTLPPGSAAAGNSLSLRVLVRSAVGAVSAVPASTTARVVLPSFASPSAQQSYQTSVTGNAQAALQAGDVGSAAASRRLAVSSEHALG